MRSLPLPMRSPQVETLGAAFWLLAWLAVVPSPSAFGREARPPEPTFDAAAAREFPRAIIERIAAKITAQTTFQQISAEGVLRWWPRTIKLVEFVKAPSPTYPDTYLYAMRYLVSVLSDKETVAVYSTSCQVVVVYKYGQYDEPTVVCEPVNVDLTDNTPS